MSCDYKDFLSSARQIAETASSEIDHRNVASRAFYGLLHYCGIIAEETCKLGLGATHEKVVRALKANKDKNLVKLGNRLNTSRVIRTRADYYTTISFYQKESLKALKSAEKAIAEHEQQSNQNKQASS